MDWRILNIDGFVEAGEAWRMVRSVYGGMIPHRIYWMLEDRQFKSVLRCFQLRG